MILVIEQRRMKWARVWRVGERNVYRFGFGKPEEKRPLVGPTDRWEDNTEMDLTEWDGRAWVELIWLRIWNNGGLLRIQYWTFGLRKTLWISWLVTLVLPSEEGLCFMEVNFNGIANETRIIHKHYKLAGCNQQIKFHYLQPQYPLPCRLTIDLLEAVPL